VQHTASEDFALLSRLYAEQHAAGATDYLADHARTSVVLHQVNVFRWYVRHIQAGTSVLDWGSNHGPDACLLRHWFGDAIDLHACDFVPEDTFRVFRDYAKAAYSRIFDPLTLPYPAGRFDAAVGSGVLEHTAMEGEALKELYRILRPLGLLVVTYVPYAYSWAEWWQRNIRKRDFHRRVYTRRGLAALLKSHGFYPLELEFQTTVPNVVEGKQPTWWTRLGRVFRYPLPSHAVLCCVAQKMIAM